MRLIGKTLLWGTLVLALLGVGLPGLIGFYMAREFDHAVASLRVPGLVEVAGSQFDRGWFSSHARISLRPIGPLCHASPCPTVILNSRIYQGPLAFGAPGRGSLRPVLAVADTRVNPAALWPRYVFSPVPGPLILRSRVALDTRGHVALHLDGVSFQVSRRQPIAQFQTSAVDGALTTAIAGRAIAGGQLRWPSFALSPQHGGRLAWRNLELTVGKIDPAADRLDHLVLTADSITLDNGQGRATRLSQFEGDLQRSAPGQAALSLAVREVVLPDNTHGELHLKITVADADEAAWMALPGQWRTLGGLTGGAADDPRLYTDVLPGVLSPGFRLAIAKSALYTKNGPLRLSGHLSVPKALQPSTMAADTIRQLDIALRIRVPAVLAQRFTKHQIAARQGDGMAVSAQRVDQELQSLTARGLITRQSAVDGHAASYGVTLRIHNGKLTLNGHGEPGWQSVVDQTQAAIQGL
ncbi:MAG: DUF945 family protein [Salinisphaera sp.]|nr:DUF945 family protein [Salinisphaera sp.]